MFCRLLFCDVQFLLLLFWRILSSLVMINTRWHLRPCYQNTHPTCLSQNNIWQVRDPGASSHLLLGVLVSQRMCFTMKANWQSRVSKVVCFHYSLPLPKSHIWYLWKQHLTHPLTEPWRLSFIMLAPPKGKMLCFCPRLWLTWWLWAMIAARAPREHLNELTLAVWRHLAPNPLTTLLY